VRRSWLRSLPLIWLGAVPAAVRGMEWSARPPGPASAASLAAVLQDTTRRTDTTRRADTTRTRRDSAATDTTPNPLDKLNVQLRSRLEAKGEQVRNERCRASQLLSPTFSCSGTFQPAFDFQFNLLTSGSVGDRVHVNVDYDTQREFDASNSISIFYEGKAGEPLQRLEVGNVTFAPPPSRFITSGIPSGNYGVQATGLIGPLKVSAIAAQQKGNVVRDQVFFLGGDDPTLRDRTGARQATDRDIEDFQVEPRRFFFTVDPTHFGARYPNIDILDQRQMALLSAALPDTLRPTRIFLYRLLIGGQPANPNGPRFNLLGAPPGVFGGGQQPYELLRENVDYYVDPSLLWVALVRPASLANERIVVAYTLRVNGRDTTVATTGGTPDLAVTPGVPQYANLLWDPHVSPTDPAFRREIRSVYRLGGAEIRPGSVTARIVAGASADQEKPPGGGAATYLQLFGLAERTSPSEFDAANRLWPRTSDPNFAAGTAVGVPILRDRYIVLPSLQPFARAGLARDPGVPANDTLYRTPSELLYTQQHPQTVYRLRVHYESDVGSAAEQAITLNSVQLRQGSEEILLDGRRLLRDLDYTIDYELGRVAFLHPEVLFARQRRVVVRYEENPLFTSIPTTIYGLTGHLPLSHGALDFTAISQTQRTTFTRPRLGFEPAASLMAGVSGAFAWNAPALSRGLARLLPFTDSLGAARVTLEGEVAMSRPRPNAQGQAFLEAFDGEGGIGVTLSDGAWYVSSQPTVGTRLGARVGASTLDLARASTIAWQNNGTDRLGRPITFTIEQIDPQTDIVGKGLSGAETLLWLTLYPLNIGGLRSDRRDGYDWTVHDTPQGRRWRSVRTAIGPPGGGADLSRVEHIEFWALIDTALARRTRNPTLVLDLGDVSENSVAFAPESLFVSAPTALGRPDSVFTGKRIQGFDVLDTERDAFSRAFNVDRDDIGLAGDVIDKLTVIHAGGAPESVANFHSCLRGDIRLRALGDARSTCTVRNSRLDEEDIDLDGVLNFPSASRDAERIRRYIVDTSDSTTYDRRGRCGAIVNDVNGGLAAAPTLCWVHFRVPFNSPDDSANGGPSLRRVRALRLTMISGRGAADGDFITTPIARLVFASAPWVRRSDRTVRGLAGETPSTGTTIASVIGTQDSTAALPYESPPGVTDAPDDRQASLAQQRVQINEQSLRVRAVNLAPLDRAEAYYRFPEGERSFMNYKELRVWARGRGHGWGRDGELQFFIKLGRDANNFYLYRTPASSGTTRAAWEPEVHVRFERFFALREQIQRALLGVGPAGSAADSIACTGADSALIVRSGLPVGSVTRRFAACQDGYIVYTADGAVTPPNLAAVQELAVGVVRVDSARGPEPLFPGDTAEVWVDEIRLTDVAGVTGFAGTVGATVQAGDFVGIAASYTRRDPNFRQLAEQPAFATNDDVTIATSWRLDRMLPRSLGIEIPFTVAHTSGIVDPRFLARSDLAGGGIQGLRTPKTSTTSYTLGVRRATPLAGVWYAPLVNNLGVSATYATNASRSEYQTGSRNDLTFGMDYLLASDLAPAPADTAGATPGAGQGWLDRALAGLPSWIPLGPLRDGSLHLTPTQVRLSSALVRNEDRRTSFLKPASATDDPGRVVTGLNQVWRTGGILEVRPVRALTARWDVTSVRDLRDYGDSTPGARAARDEQARLAGVETGFERERSMELAVALVPKVNAWLAPRLDLTSTYAMLRDPNASLIGPPADTTIARLPRRLGNTQAIAASATVDVPRLATTAGLDSTDRWGRIVRTIQPVDITLTRNLVSAFDGVPFDPGIGYQFAIGDATAFRREGGVFAASAGVADQLSVSNTLLLPAGVTVGSRYQWIGSRNWARHLADAQSRIDGRQVVFPDVTLRWTARPSFAAPVLTNVGLSARILQSRQQSLLPLESVGLRAEERTSRVRSYPVSGTIVWAGNVSTTAGYTYASRVDSLPGSVSTSASNDLSGEIAKTFTLPAKWKVGLDNRLRARAGYQAIQTASFVSNLAASGARSRLTDNGRRAVTASAETTLAENLTFSLQGSRVVNFDRNLNRRFVQTVFNAVFQLQFFAGELR
jgi:hypothetical protein